MIKISPTGEISCNTVKYNYLQCRNLIADSTFAGGVWTLSNGVSRVSATDQRSSYGHLATAGTAIRMTTQPMPTPIANHKYYGGLFWQTNTSSFSSPDARFEWYNSDGNNNTHLVFAQKTTATSGAYVKLSSIVQAGSSPVSGTWQIRNFVVNPSTNCRWRIPFIIDLTAAFGAGNEPTKEWCDENILEWGKFYNHGLITTAVTNSNYNTAWTKGSFLNLTPYNYRGLPYQPYYPSDYLFDMFGNPDYNESLMYQAATVPIVQGNYYYFGADITTPTNYEGTSADCYVPEAEPALGSVPYVVNTQYNGGGGMNAWKRYSFFNIRSNWASGNMTLRFDTNNMKKSTSQWGTNFHLTNVNNFITIFNSLASSNATAATVNKEFMDRWCGGQNMTIIHIKNHRNTAIKFNTNYDIVCNDIVIKPEISRVYFEKSTGTIYCRKLTKVQKY